MATLPPSKPLRRRPHHKSRRGCTTCKRRRVKCDERHPACRNCENLGLACAYAAPGPTDSPQPDPSPLNTTDILLFHHYTSSVWKTIVGSGISNKQIWKFEVPRMAFEYEFLMRAVLTFSANHYSRKTASSPRDEMDRIVTTHRGHALRLLGQAVRHVTPANRDALVASSILLILDAMANASAQSAVPHGGAECAGGSSLPASAWMHHVRGAATICTAIGSLAPDSLFFHLVNVDLMDLVGGGVGGDGGGLTTIDPELEDLYPITQSSPYYHALTYLHKLFSQRYKSDFILRVFSLPALLDKRMVRLLLGGDVWAKRIVKVYYKLVRSYTSEMKDKVWFLEGVARILPIDTDQELGGLGFLLGSEEVVVPGSGEAGEGEGNETSVRGSVRESVRESAVLEPGGFPVLGTGAMAELAELVEFGLDDVDSDDWSSLVTGLGTDC